MTRSSAPDRPRWSGLDGLRALAVAGVVAYHFGPAEVPGGFLGVDVFFVLSGYLITRMIATEYLDTGRFRFGHFYRRRARRLLPGVAVLLVATLAVAAFWRDQLSTVRGASAAAATYVSNWWLSFAHQSYFVSAGRPSMLQHLWSLAVEEQFYLLWPLLAVAVLALVGPGHGARATPAQRSRYLAGAATVLALASATEMSALAIASNAPYGTDASRLYYGTDTHSMGLLLGAALGALAAGRYHSRPTADRPLAQRLLRRAFGRLIWLSDAVAVLALVALAVALFGIHEQTPALYRGGFLAVAAIAAIAVAAVARPGSRVGPAIDRRPLRWLAARSYAIYLWHWPVTTVTRPGVDVHWPAPMVLAVRVAATVLLADLTYRGVEAPVRRLGLRTSVRHGVGRLGRVIAGQAPVGARLATATLVGAVLLAGGVLAAGPAPTLSAGQKSLAAERGGRDLPLGHLAPAAPVTRPVGSIEQRLGSDAPTRSPVARSTPVRAQPAPPPATGRLPTISAFGDSVMLGARPALDARFPGGTMDAVEGRQADPILRDIERAAVGGRLNPLVVIGVGDNGLIDPTSLMRTMRQLRVVKHVIVLNNRVGRFWQDANNRTLARIVPHFANATLLDWHSVAGRHPSWLYDDGIHLTPQGAVAYTDLIVTAARPTR